MFNKMFSDKFWNRFNEVVIQNAGEIVGLHKSKIIFYPFSPKGWKDIRTVFSQSAEEDATLIKYYKPYWNKGRTRWQKFYKVAEAVNRRVYKYIKDIDNPQYKRAEYWGSPITVHNIRQDDCDGYAVLLTNVLRLLGAKEQEVFVAKGWVYHVDGSRVMHAYCLVFDLSRYGFGQAYPLEGSFYQSESIWYFRNKVKSLTSNNRYAIPDWITNDTISYANTPWFKFVK